MAKETLLNIRTARRNEAYHAGWGGTYQAPDGQAFLLTRAMAVTFGSMLKLKTHEEQFEFFCLAYLREERLPYLGRGGDKILEFEKRLIAKYDLPWQGNVKNTLPAISVSFFRGEALSVDGTLNMEFLRKKFQEYSRYKFVVYDQEIFGPPQGKDGRSLRMGDPRWDMEIGNYSSYQAGIYVPAFAIPNSVDFPELRKRLFAAALSIDLGIESIDYTLKHHTAYIERPTLEEPAASVVNILNELKSNLNNFTKSHDHPHEERDILGMLAATAALNRCKSTFEASLVLLGNGFFIDACILGRHVIEQVAWSLHISEMNDMETLERVGPQSCVAELGFQPYGKRLYGTLSEFAHLSVKRRHEYFRIVDNIPATLNRSTEDALRLAPLLILVLDVYVSGYELLFMEECRQKSWVSWKIVNGKPVLKKTRPLQRLFEKHRDKYQPPFNQPAQAP